ncbi:sigma-70 family RNA polymerase sigma factor [Okeania sp. KiyG1]|uniref:sigma-70 family RNA polymerase sigma factor n=1 Tax=Okeania sp. KiyG1 TaxID=2720165 RepID=UPI001F00720A|nr:sigma-70 family RNA polymerase sigma factor [Okeania sp. KiyG1]
MFWQQWTEYQDQLYRCCLKFMNSNPTDAEDALSQAMLKAWEKIQKYAGKIDNLKAWLFKLTSNLCIDIIRQRSRGAVGVESIEWVGDTEDIGIGSTIATPESCLEREEKSTEIRQAIANLPKTLRETFILHFYQELTHTEIAQRQGITYENVSRRISRARKQLKEKLSSYFRGTGEKVKSCQVEDCQLGLMRGRGDAGTQGSFSNGQLCRHDISVTARDPQMSSTSWENEEKQQTIESQENIGLETVTVSPSFDTQLLSKNDVETDLETQRHGDGSKMNALPLNATGYEEVKKPECVDSSVESWDNVYKQELTLVENTSFYDTENKPAGRFILATNILDSQQLRAEEEYFAYQEQPTAERRFASLIDYLFFADCVFIKTAKRKEERRGQEAGMSIMLILPQQYTSTSLVEAGESNPCSFNSLVGFPVETMSQAMLKARDSVRNFAGPIDNLKALLFKLLSTGGRKLAYHY